MPAKKPVPPAKTNPADPGPIPEGKICTLNGFLRQFVKQHSSRVDQPFCFILGAGASRDSNIKTGGEMAKDWLEMLHEDQNHEGLSYEEWIKSGKLGIDGFDPKNPAAHYSQLYELLYKDKDQAGFSYLETIMEDKDPSFGYSVLSFLLSETHHRIVITTNFDNLVTDALAIHSGTFPIVVNDDSLVHYVRANVHRPLVAKIHGSLGFKPKSIEDDLTLDDGWQKALAAIFQTHTPVVIGYDGNDRSLMRLLNETVAENPPEFIWWCYHCKEGENPIDRANDQPPHVRELILKRPAQMVPTPGFDLFMLKLLLQLEKLPTPAPDLVQNLEKRTATRLEAYKKQRSDLGAKLVDHARKPTNETPKQTKSTKDTDLNDELALLAKGTGKKQWWEWQLEIDAETDPRQQDKLYNEAINSLPESPELLENYAFFLMAIRKNNATAEVFYKRVIDANPTDGRSMCNYANLLSQTSKDHIETEAFYKRAIQADPNCGNTLGSYAQFLIGRGNLIDGIANLVAAWSDRNSFNNMTKAEMAYSLWIGSLISGEEQKVWLQVFKYLITNGFPRTFWSFDAMLSQAKKTLKSEDLEYAKSVAEAFLYEDKVAALKKFTRWRKLEPIDPKLVNPDGTVSVS